MQPASSPPGRVEVGVGWEKTGESLAVVCCYKSFLDGRKGLHPDGACCGVELTADHPVTIFINYLYCKASKKGRNLALYVHYYGTFGWGMDTCYFA